MIGIFAAQVHLAQIPIAVFENSLQKILKWISTMVIKCGKCPIQKTLTNMVIK